MIGSGSLTSRGWKVPDLLHIYQRYMAQDYSSLDIGSVLEAVSSASPEVIFQLHPLGFIHGELSPSLPLPEGERFRLHIWLSDAGSLDQLGDLHEHTWELTSLVLVGAVVDRNYEALPSPEGDFVGARILYGSENRSEPMGSYRLCFVGERTVRVGGVYKIPSRTIHLNRVSEVPTVTLVRSVEDDRGDGPLVLTPSSGDQGLATGVRTRLNASEVFRRLHAAMGW